MRKCESVTDQPKKLYDHPTRTGRDPLQILTKSSKGVSCFNRLSSILAILQNIKISTYDIENSIVSFVH